VYDEIELALFYALTSPFIAEEEAQRYMVARANIGDDVGVDADQVEVATKAWCDKSSSIIIGDNEIVLPVYMTTWLTIDGRLVLIRVCTHSYMCHVESH